MTDGHQIANIAYLFGSDKAIRSDGPMNTVWFYRIDRDFVVHQHGEVHTVDRDTIERNINHRDTDVETHPVEESPFGP